MKLEHYPFSTDAIHLNFEFESDGPNGKIKKLMTFIPENIGGTTFFNLAFGNWNEEVKELDDKAVSNNQDRNKILATVAAAVIEFTIHFPDTFVFAQGSSQSRTRLYQMGISANLEEIESILYVFGLSKGRWERFRKDRNYDAFLIRRKASKA